MLQLVIYCERLQLGEAISRFISVFACVVVHMQKHNSNWSVIIMAVETIIILTVCICTIEPFCCYLSASAWAACSFNLTTSTW